MYFKDASTSDLQRNSPQYRSLERHLRGISRTPSQFCKLQVTDKHYKSLSMQMYRIFVFYGIFNIFSSEVMVAACHEAKKQIQKQTFLFVIRCSQCALANDEWSLWSPRCAIPWSLLIFAVAARAITSSLTSTSSLCASAHLILL